MERTPPRASKCSPACPEPVTIREAARRAGRDVKAVHGDVHALLNAGILHKTERGLIVFPFGAIRVDVMLHAA
jgi:predicted transcriptional regulator